MVTKSKMHCLPQPSSAAGRRHLRSAYTRQLIIPRTRTSYGDCSFAVHGPVVWNSLPHDLRSTDLSLAKFRNRLKTFLFDGDT